VPFLFFFFFSSLLVCRAKSSYLRCVPTPFELFFFFFPFFPSLQLRTPRMSIFFPKPFRATAREMERCLLPSPPPPDGVKVAVPRTFSFPLQVCPCLTSLPKRNRDAPSPSFSSGRAMGEQLFSLSSTPCLLGGDKRKVSLFFFYIASDARGDPFFLSSVLPFRPLRGRPNRADPPFFFFLPLPPPFSRSRGIRVRRVALPPPFFPQGSGTIFLSPLFLFVERGFDRAILVGGGPLEIEIFFPLLSPSFPPGFLDWIEIIGFFSSPSNWVFPRFPQGRPFFPSSRRRGGHLWVLSKISSECFFLFFFSFPFTRVDDFSAKGQDALEG